MNLPQELLDDILSYLPSEDSRGRQWLASCSLVSKSWTNPSRRHLFRVVDIREKSLRSWQDTISPTNHEFLQHIRALSYVTNTKTWRGGWSPEYRIDVLQDFLPSLHRLQYLSLHSTRIPSDISPRLEIFSAFRYTLSRLSLSHCDITISALVALINYFPNLDHLDLSYLLHNTDGKPAPSLSRPRISRLHLPQFRPYDIGILSRLLELGLAFDEVVVDRRLPIRLPALTCIVDAVGGKVKYLRLLRTSRTYRQPGVWSALLSPCRELQEFELVVTRPGDHETEIISSITSASIRKISLVYRCTAWDPSWRGVDWEAFNEPLCRLVDRLDPTSELEVEIRIVDVGGVSTCEDADLGVIVNSLATFREKGPIRLVYVGQDERAHVVYPLDPCSPNPPASVC